MRLLFELDKKDYDIHGKAFVRPSVRGIIIRNGKIAMVHSLKYDYYKFPGGGIENNESQIETLIREVQEEAGLVVIPETIKEYGLVHRIQKGKIEPVYIQDNFYYLCQTEPTIISQHLDDYEANERFTLEFVEPQIAIAANREKDHGPKDPIMLEREAKVLECLIRDGFFDNIKEDSK